MSHKTLPLTASELESLTKRFPTPFHLYDEAAIRAGAKALKEAFAPCPNFREYYAVKACPNPFLLKILASEGFGADCSSLPEIVLAQRAGITGEMIMFTSNDTPANEFVQAARVGAVINFDDISHIEFAEKALKAAGMKGLPELACCRYNPGPLKGGNEIIGKPEEAKYGFTREQLFSGYALLKAKGVTRFGIHTMVASNELNADYFIETARILIELARDIAVELGIQFEFINLGGGIGIPYRPDQEAVDIVKVGKGVAAAYAEFLTPAGLKPAIYLESGRLVTGPHGWLVTRVIHEKRIYRDYLGTDASMADLMRPGLYGAYHHISVVGKDHAAADHVYDVTGSLCENNDKFAVQRKLPETKPGDLLVIHDTGAHGRAMCFNYNGKLRSGEVLRRTDGSFVQIRRRETMDDYFATLDFAALDAFDGSATARGGKRPGRN